MKTIVKGDQKIPAISAASIIAKVSRDKFIISLAKKNSGYYWHQNFGYGTKQHLSAIKKYDFVDEQIIQMKSLHLYSESYNI